jgi:hypothetical protein
MDNVQKHNTCTKVPSSQTLKSCVLNDINVIKKHTKQHDRLLETLQKDRL